MLTYPKSTRTARYIGNDSWNAVRFPSTSPALTWGALSDILAGILTAGDIAWRFNSSTQSWQQPSEVERSYTVKQHEWIWVYKTGGSYLWDLSEMGYEESIQLTMMTFYAGFNFYAPLEETHRHIIERFLGNKLTMIYYMPGMTGDWIEWTPEISDTLYPGLPYVFEVTEEAYGYLLNDITKPHINKVSLTNKVTGDIFTAVRDGVVKVPTGTYDVDAEIENQRLFGWQFNIEFHGPAGLISSAKTSVISQDKVDTIKFADLDLTIIPDTLYYTISAEV